jgi:hypothetical protein
VGDNFFPGHSGYFKDDSIHLALFALDYTQGPETNIYIEAFDRQAITPELDFTII